MPTTSASRMKGSSSYKLRQTSTTIWRKTNKTLVLEMLRALGKKTTSRVMVRPRSWPPRLESFAESWSPT